MNNRRGQKNILLLSTADWDNPFWTNKQRMAVLFAEHDYNVVYVDSLGLRQPSLHPRDIKRIFKRLLKAVPIPRNVAKNIWRISPFLLPFHSIPFVRRINRYILLLTIKWNLFLLGIRRPLIITYTPIVVISAGHCRMKASFTIVLMIWERLRGLMLTSSGRKRPGWHKSPISVL